MTLLRRLAVKSIPDDGFSVSVIADQTSVPSPWLLHSDVQKFTNSFVTR
jgi:hypothetical protein